MPTGMKYQGLRELFLVTQWKDNCVYRTRSVGYGYVTLDYKSEDRNLIISSLNTAMSKLLLPSQQMIKVADNAPDIVRVSITITHEGKVKIGEQ